MGGCMDVGNRKIRVAALTLNVMDSEKNILI